MYGEIDAIWDFFGDRGIFFPVEKGNIFSGTSEQMKKCLSIVELYEGYLVIQLKKDAYYEDTMGWFDEYPVEGSGTVAVGFYVQEYCGYETLDLVPENNYKERIDYWRSNEVTEEGPSNFYNELQSLNAEIHSLNSTF